MLYKYLWEWQNQVRFQNLTFKEIRKFEDQYAIFFRNEKLFLQINLSSQDCFCFFSSNIFHKFEKAPKLHNINSNLHNAKLNKIGISDNDRIINLYFTRLDVDNLIKRYRLIIELIPMCKNIILVGLFDSSGTSKNKIIDCLRKFSATEKRPRKVSPGIKYETPKSDYKNIKEGIDYPLYYNSEGKIVENSKETWSYKNINSLFEELYFNWIYKNKIARLKQKEISLTSKKISRKQKKIYKLEQELADTEREEKWKQQAELLKANFDKIKPGMGEITLIDYYQEDLPEIEIILQKDKNARQNIEFYFKKFRKARDGKTKIKQQIELTENEIRLLKKEIEEIREKEDFIIRKEEKISKKISEITKCRKLVINENWEILIGRSNKENDLLTTKIAKHYDWWFHTRIFHGTHLILRNFKKKELPDNLKLICCRLAAYYSKAKKSSNVPVDYTQIRYVRKPRKSPPGFVTYINQKTLFVDPLSIRDAKSVLSRLDRI